VVVSLVAKSGLLVPPDSALAMACFGTLRGIASTDGFSALNCVGALARGLVDQYLHLAEEGVFDGPLQEIEEGLCIVKPNSGPQVVDALSRLQASLVQSLRTNAEAEPKAEWCMAWRAVLDGMSQIVYTPVYRSRRAEAKAEGRQDMHPCSKERGEALNALKGAVQGLHGLPVRLVYYVFDEVLLPLLHKVCDPAATSSAAGGDKAGGAGFFARFQLQDAVAKAFTLDDEKEGGKEGVSTTQTKGGEESRLLSLAAAVDSVVFGGTTPAKSPSTPMTPDADLVLYRGQGPGALGEIQGKVLSMLCQALLAHLTELVKGGDGFLALWEKILGTLYAYYSRPPQSGFARTEIFCDSVREQVKNVVFVISTQDPPPPLPAGFWRTTRDLLDPFGREDDREGIIPLVEELAAVLDHFDPPRPKTDL